MNDGDEAACQYLEEAKRFLELAREWGNAGDDGPSAALHASLILAVSSLEAHVNAIAEEFMAHQADRLSLLEQSILLEKDVDFSGDGDFVLAGRLKMYRLTDRILFVYRRFSRDRAPYDRTKPSWSHLAEGLSLRNALVHSRDRVDIDEGQVARLIEAVVDTVDTLFRDIYDVPMPGARRGLDSRLSFG